MQITYDKEADAVYIYLVEIGPGEVKKTYCCDRQQVGGLINLDFDRSNRLIGIEVLNASSKLPERFFEQNDGKDL
jgi:uncharacterized protein YuzE